MKKIVPFKKEIAFKTNIAEITSISLEHTLKVDNYMIDGYFIVSGEYKMADISTNTESFSFDLPFSIAIDEKYILDKIEVDIDDFYYEIVNDRTLVVNIDVLINNLEEKPLIEITKQSEVIEENTINDELLEETESREEKEELIEVQEDKTDNEIEQQIAREEVIYEADISEIEENPIKIEDTIKEVAITNEISADIFNTFTEKESVSTYRVYIVREGDIIEGIMEKYGTSKEILEKYNDLSNIKIGDKLIIPSE